LAAVICAVCVAACAHWGASSAAPTWLTSLDRGHPLVGRIWSVRRHAFVDASAVVADAGRARFVLLGEKHDNPDHHRLQAEVLAALVAAGRRPAVAFEMLETTQQVAVDRYREQHHQDPARDAAGLGAAVGWAESGWPAWTAYLPIAEVAFRHQLPIVAANLPHAEARALARGEPGGPDAARRAALGLEAPLPADAERSLLDELRASHCGLLPEAALPRMLLAQRARDAQMAERLRAGASSDGAVLISGAGHARLDRGVPWYLRRAAGNDERATVLSVAFMEVDHATTDPQAYAADAAFDYLWFTPRATDDDPCAEMGDQKAALRPSGAGDRSRDPSSPRRRPGRPARRRDGSSRAGTAPRGRAARA
jgi:uncharacterized iron-regulated protein